MNTKTRTRRLLTAMCVVIMLAGMYGAPAFSQEFNESDEAVLIETLTSDAGWEAKHFACRALRKVGTPASVPALAALLPDEKLSHMARFALEPMPCACVDTAFREALATTQGMPKVGVITSIGARRDAKAAPLLNHLLGDGDLNIARAAAGALGRIATPEAVEALLAFRASACAGMRPALAEALLAAANQLAADGKGDAAAAVYNEMLVPGWPKRVRMGAFAGLMAAQPQEAPTRLIIALDGCPMFRAMAAQIVAETSEGTDAYCAALPKLSPAGQAALLRGLADRADPVARPVVAEAAASEDPQVKLAAVKALGVVGDNANDVALLTPLLQAENPDLAAAAEASLTAMSGHAVDAAIADTIAGSGPAIRAQLLTLLASRRAEQAMAKAVESRNDADLAVRVAGLDAMALLGGKPEAPVLVQAIAKAEGAEEKAAAEKALDAVCSRKGEEVLPCVLEGMNGASPEAQAVLLGALVRVGGAKALDAVSKAVQSPEAAVSEEAVRLLSEWPSADVAPYLKELAQGDDLKRHVLAVRGLVRLAREAEGGERAKMLREIAPLVRRPDEKRLVVAAWGTLKHKVALDALTPYLDDADVKNEAALAIIPVATEWAKKDAPAKEAAAAALQAVIDKCENADTKAKAQEALASIK